MFQNEEEMVTRVLEQKEQNKVPDSFGKSRHLQSAQLLTFGLKRIQSSSGSLKLHLFFFLFRNNYPEEHCIPVGIEATPHLSHSEAAFQIY